MDRRLLNRTEATLKAEISPDMQTVRGPMALSAYCQRGCHSGTGFYRVTGQTPSAADEVMQLVARVTHSEG
jgi:hypothetical protein